MKTNANTESDVVLNNAARKLMEAAYEFWMAHQTVCGSNAVVWLENVDTGHFILFTRSEYKKAILNSAGIETDGEPFLSNPFTVKE